MEIFFVEDRTPSSIDIHPYMEEIIKDKGWRGDVVVKIDNLYYKLEICHITRFQQDLTHAIEHDGYFLLTHNTVIVEDLSKESIISKLNNLYETKRYFEFSYSQTKEELNKFLDSINFSKIP